jgi:hypothetical protein
LKTGLLDLASGKSIARPDSNAFVAHKAARGSPNSYSPFLFGPCGRRRCTYKLGCDQARELRGGITGDSDVVPASGHDGIPKAEASFCTRRNGRTFLREWCLRLPRVVLAATESGACGYRQLLAGILRKLDKLRIGSVVLDYSFSPRECKDATGELQDAIDQLAEHNVPVVYGQRTYTAEELEGDPRLSNELGPLKAAGFKNDDRGAMAIGYCAFSWAGVRRIISAGLRHTPSSYHLGRLPKKF